MQTKLYQFNEQLQNEIVGLRIIYLQLGLTIGSCGSSLQSTSSTAMSDQELGLIDETFSYLSQILIAPPSSPPNTLNASHINAIIALLERWPLSQRFPGE